MLLLPIATRVVWSGFLTLDRVQLLALVCARGDLGGLAPVLVGHVRSRGRFRFSHRRCALAFSGRPDRGPVAGTGGRLSTRRGCWHGCRIVHGREDAPGGVTDGSWKRPGGRGGDASGRQANDGDRDQQPDASTPTWPAGRPRMARRARVTARSSAMPPLGRPAQPGLERRPSPPIARPPRRTQLAPGPGEGHHQGAVRRGRRPAPGDPGPVGTGNRLISADQASSAPMVTPPSGRADPGRRRAAGPAAAARGGSGPGPCSAACP